MGMQKARGEPCAAKDSVSKGDILKDKLIGPFARRSVRCVELLLCVLLHVATGVDPYQLDKYLFY